MNNVHLIKEAMELAVPSFLLSPSLDTQSVDSQLSLSVLSLCTMYLCPDARSELSAAGHQSLSTLSSPFLAWRCSKYNKI